MAKIIVVGNEKGGSGKTTTAMHLLVYLLQKEKKIGTIDLDLRQLSFFRYIENRELYIKENNINLVLPEKYKLNYSVTDSRTESKKEEQLQFKNALKYLNDKRCDYILIDCPGANTSYSQFAHENADLLITPLNDSFVDFDLLAHSEIAKQQIKHSSIYSEMIWTARKERLHKNLLPMEWVVLRNRSSQLNSRNQKKLDKFLLELSKRAGFKIIPGFSERMIYRELFPLGLTLLDLKILPDWKLSISHISARNEIREFVSALKL
jgi:chromosome partitioning protein